MTSGLLRTLPFLQVPFEIFSLPREGKNRGLKNVDNGHRFSTIKIDSNQLPRRKQRGIKLEVSQYIRRKRRGIIPRAI